ncbi:MAG: 2-octaprenyl-6-methoxyphenyl hydroxylase [Gammaproteobacteria bacterium]|nr:2-octaprenyl-6-methoxyphenyl hydroxylase [Gammaproteobacteria bacterium]
MSTPQEFDLIVVGAGQAAASLAAALRGSGLRTAVVERWPLEHDKQPSYDDRTVALTWSARRIYEGIGVWSAISGEAEPIRDIHVSDRGGFGMTHLSHRHAGTPALGYVVPTRVLGGALLASMESADSVTLYCPARATELRVTGDRGHLALEQDGQTVNLSAPLVVVADGGRSGLAGGEDSHPKPYPQQALLSIVTTDRPHRGRAWERFTGEGPLAMLPLSGNRLAVVWTSMPKNLASRQAMDDDGFVLHLQRTFGDRAGNLERPSARKAYPLHRSHLRHPARDRRVVLGNAAHTVHPVAGQGFNLGLRDVAVLAELVFRARLAGRDIGSEVLLQEYNDLRRRDTFMVRQFTHSMVTLFCADLPGARLARNLGLKGVELFPPAKRFLLRRTMGLAGPLGLLARGLPLDCLAAGGGDYAGPPENGAAGP